MLHSRHVLFSVILTRLNRKIGEVFCLGSGPSMETKASMVWPSLRVAARRVPTRNSNRSDDQNLLLSPNNNSSRLPIGRIQTPY